MHETQIRLQAYAAGSCTWGEVPLRCDMLQWKRDLAYS